MTEAVCVASQLGKRYVLYSHAVDRFLTGLPFYKPRLMKEHWALRDVDLLVPPGRCLGIIGMNGAGKSTLLKLLTGVVQPSTGTLSIDGEVLALLELGTGFNMELSGRENVFLTGSLLGHSREDLSAALDAIETFADIGEYFNLPAKTYSSGMFVRLAFSLYVNLVPSVLIVDEALSVGDFFFQQKCFAAMRDLKARGVTILLASHDMAAVNELCDEVILLNHGTIVARGDAATVVGRYHALSSQPVIVTAEAPQSSEMSPMLPPEAQNRYSEILADDVLAGSDSIGDHGASLRALRLLDETGVKADRFQVGGLLRLEVVVEAHQKINFANFGVSIADDQDRAIWSTATSNYDLWLSSSGARDISILTVDITLAIPAGKYTLSVASGEVDPYDPSHAIWNDLRLKAISIEVIPSIQSLGRTGIVYIEMDVMAL